MITFANENVKNQIADIWHEAFGDSKEFVYSFLGAADYENTCLVCLDGGRAASMLFMLPAEAVSDKNHFFGKYIYAVATGKEFRGRGYAKKLLSYAELAAQELRSSFLILVPAEKSLFSFYEKLGYTIKTKADKIDASYNGFYSASVRKCSSDEFYNGLMSVYGNCDYIYHQKESLKSILSAVSPDCGTYYIESSEGCAFALAEINGGVLNIGELAVSNMDRTQAADALMYALKANKAHITAKGNSHDFALIKPLDSSFKIKNPYFNIAFN